MKLTDIKHYQSGIKQANNAALILKSSQVDNIGNKVSLEGGGPTYRQSAMNYGNYLDAYSPKTMSLALYRLIRGMIPFIDTAITKMGLFVGSFTFHSDDQKLQDHLRLWSKRVQVNYFGAGLDEWIKQIVESAFVLGMGIGQRAFDEGMFTTNRMYNGNAEYLRFIQQGGDLELGYQTPSMFRAEPFDNPEDMFYLAFDQRDGNPFGHSILESIPIAAQVYTRLNEALHNQVWRIGDPTYFFTVTGNKDAPESKGPKTVYNTISSGLKEVFKARQRGQVMDIGTYAPGGYDIQVKMLGADGTVPLLEFDFPTRMVIEQMISVFPIPPWSYNLFDWNSNYKMSEDQKDLLQSAVSSYRSKIDSLIDKLVFGEKISQGKPSAKVWWTWSDISLTDAKDKAQTRHLNASAQEKESNTAIMAWQLGQINDDQLFERLVEIGVVPDESEKDQVLENARTFKRMFLLNSVGNNIFGKQNLEQLRKDV